MTLLNKDILKKQSSPLTKKYIDEWDCEVYFKKFTIADEILLEKLNSKKRITEVEKLLNIIILACVDDKGEKIFKPEDKDELMDMQSSALNKIVQIANEETGLNDQDIEEKAKNS
jgi:hypothetical protein